MLINHFLENSAAKYPDKEAVYFKNQCKTYAEIDLLANKVANCLKDNGIQRGDRVAIVLECSIDHVF